MPTTARPPLLPWDIQHSILHAGAQPADWSSSEPDEEDGQEGVPRRRFLVVCARVCRDWNVRLLPLILLIAVSAFNLFPASEVVSLADPPVCSGGEQIVATKLLYERITIADAFFRRQAEVDTLRLLLVRLRASPKEERPAVGSLHLADNREAGEVFLDGLEWVGGVREVEGLVWREREKPTTTTTGDGRETSSLGWRVRPRITRLCLRLERSLASADDDAPLRPLSSAFDLASLEHVALRGSTSSPRSYLSFLDSLLSSVHSREERWSLESLKLSSFDRAIPLAMLCPTLCGLAERASRLERVDVEVSGGTSLDQIGELREAVGLEGGRLIVVRVG